MRNENGYICFILVVGSAFLAAGYFVEILYVVLGVLVMLSGIITSMLAKLENKVENTGSWEEVWETFEITDTSSTYAAK